MKVILLKEVKTLGKINQVIEVSDGYAKNYLIPNKLAVVASEHALDKNQAIKTEELKMAIEKVKYYQKVKADLDNVTLEFHLKVNNDKVSGAISAKQICAYLHYNFQIDVDKHKFIGFKPINKIGVTEVAVRLMADVTAYFKVKVLAE